MKTETDEVRLIPADVLQRFVEQVFVALGTPTDDARICADVLLAADRLGIESHGVSRLRLYYDRIRAGIQMVETEFEVVTETETTAVVDGHHGMGAAIAFRAMRLAMDKAARHGLGAVAVRNSTHFGIAGYYARMAAAEGMIGLALTNAQPIIVPTFGAEPMLGTNPIAFAAPADTPFPFSFDAATSTVARGKIEVLARTDKPVPAGWVVDATGRPLAGAAQVLRAMDTGAAMLLPLGGAGEASGGHKGFGLATMVEILCASLSGGVALKDLSGLAPDGSLRHLRVGHFFLAVDVAHFLPVDTSRQITGQILRDLQGAHRMPGQERIYVAGEKEHERQARAAEQGIALNRSLRCDLQAVRDALSIAGYEAYF